MSTGDLGAGQPDAIVLRRTNTAKTIKQEQPASERLLLSPVIINKFRGRGSTLLRRFRRNTISVASHPIYERNS